MFVLCVHMDMKFCLVWMQGSMWGRVWFGRKCKIGVGCMCRICECLVWVVFGNIFWKECLARVSLGNYCKICKIGGMWFECNIMYFYNIRLQQRFTTIYNIVVIYYHIIQQLFNTIQYCKYITIVVGYKWVTIL